jgi:hypothetical protein
MIPCFNGLPELVFGQPPRRIGICRSIFFLHLSTRFHDSQNTAAVQPLLSDFCAQTASHLQAAHLQADGYILERIRLAIR